MKRATCFSILVFIAVSSLGEHALVGCSRGDETGSETKGKSVTSERNAEVPPGQNRLALEKSPYLLQHADNPVDWYPWGEEAFEAAREQDKPIFLSIGYSTCHWCHVMEHESFEDSTVARLMNETFISIKVDREERPDIDNVYMMFCQMMTGSGGWPLTIFMTPDRRPFFAATYIPRDGRYGRGGMMQFIPQIRDAWINNRSDLVAQSNTVTGQLTDYLTSRAAGDELGADVLDSAYRQMSQRFDAERGGFGSAPKFPTPHNLLFLLRYWKRSGEARALEMVRRTLDAMADGGIYDHVGFGFHRYSTDADWFAPHFEKMLYDQAMLAMAYTEAHVATGEARYRRIASEVLNYVLRDMTDPRGGFYSAEDADSEEIEGKFYLWTSEELRQLLGDEDAGWVMDLFGVEETGNFAEEVERANILHVKRSPAKVAEGLGLSAAEFEQRFETARRKLFDEREKRIHPYKDDKILTDWNGLMIAAMAKAGRALDEPRFVEGAEKAARFILESMRDGDGLLRHRYRDGESAIGGHVDDYAFLIWGLLELYETTFDAEYLQTALELNRTLLEHFWDDTQGGFFFSSDQGEALIVRMKEVYDSAIPSGNSVAMLNLIRLGRITADTELEDRAARVGKAFYADVSRAPAAFTQLLSALDFGVGPSYEVVIVGSRQGTDTRAMQRALVSTYVPNKVVLFKPTSERNPPIGRLAAYTRSQTAIEGKATAYVCRNYACELPTTDARKMLELLTRPVN